MMGPVGLGSGLCGDQSMCENYDSCSVNCAIVEFVHDYEDKNNPLMGKPGHSGRSGRQLTALC